ncbi:MAG: hypothetical protein LH472_15915 [Pyrinomonadaceae bacterium]|nr:hypothetical protein [Pyrinomonadaceae bacterium]
MNLTDLFIIYFAVGAPLAVYYFLQNRSDGKIALFWLKNLLVFLFWMPFAVSLLLQRQNRRSLSNLNFFDPIFAKDSGEERISTLQKQIEIVLLKSNLDRSIFDLRETIERFVGLTLASEIDGKLYSEKEFLRAAGNSNEKLGAICLDRRNRNKLARHQTEARRDFLQFVEQLSDSISDTETLEHSTVEIVKILEDAAARRSLEKMFAENLQTGKLPSVKYSEKDLWKPQERQPLRIETISTRL